MKNSKILQVSGKCIFCGEGNLSKEHLWSKWLTKLLPPLNSDEHIEHLSTYTQMTKLVGPPKIREKSGNTYTKTVRVVCVGCNNGWMSRIENEVAPILTPMIASTPCILDKTQISAVVSWIVLKVMVAEKNQRGDAVTSDEERRLFKDNGTIPGNLRIWLGRCGIEGWAGTYWRHAATISFGPVLPATGTAKNIHCVTFGVGDVLIHVLHSSLENLGTLYEISPADKVIPLYPNISGNVTWPPQKSLSVSEAAGLSKMLDDVLKRKVIGWKEFPKDEKG